MRFRQGDIFDDDGLLRLTEAIEKYGVPEIFNTDQGSQFTSTDFTQILKDNSIKISMDGKGVNLRVLGTTHLRPDETTLRC